MFNHEIKIDEVRTSFLDGLSRVCLTLGLGHFVCVPALYFLFGDQPALTYRYYSTTLTLSGGLLTGIAFLCRFKKIRSGLSYLCLSLLFGQTCLFLFHQESLQGPVAMMFPMFSALATPILGRRHASHAMAALSFSTFVVFTMVRSTGSEAFPYPILAILAIVLFATSYVSETLWSGMVLRELRLEQALLAIAKKNDEMESWVTRLGQVGTLISAGQLSTEIPHHPPSQVFEELTRSMEQMQEKLSHYFTKLFLEDRLSSLGILASGVAHELNTPLTTMHFLLQGTPGIPAETRKKLTEEIERMTGITKGLLSFARPTDELGADLNEVVRGTLALLRQGPRFAGQIEAVFCSMPVPISALANEVQQVVINLFHNAADALENIPNAKITIRTMCDASTGIVELTDNGCGIEPESLSKIFDPFFTTKQPGRGTGLGLFIVHQIMQRHGGKIEIESKRNEGTTVRLRFALDKNRSQKEKAA